MRKMMFELFDPASCSRCSCSSATPRGDVWTYYHLMRTRDGASALTEGHDAAYANRALALFRHYAGNAAVPVTWWR